MTFTRKILFMVFGCASLFLLSLFLTSCAYTRAPLQGGLYTGVTTPVTYMSAKENRTYEILGTVEGKATAIAVLGIIASGDAGINKAYQVAKAQRPDADGLVDISIDQTYSSVLGLFASYTTIVHAKAVKWMSYSASEGKISRADILPGYPSQQIGPTIDGIGFALSLSRGSLNELDESQYYYYYESNNKGNSLTGLGGLRWNFFITNRNALYYFYPHISYSNLGKNSIGYIRTIPLIFNVGINGSHISSLAENLPEGLNPFANFGVGYYLSEIYGDWKWTEFGYNFGLGIDYSLQPNLAINFGFNHHSVIIGQNYSYWDWSLGLKYFLTNR